MTARTVTLDDETRSASRGRWWQLLVGVLCMSMIANLQYGWTLFVNPISARHGWGRAAIQVAFTLFVLTETWLVPIEGYLVDRFGPRIVVLVASFFVGIAWVMNSYASSLPALYVAAVIGGIGAGAVYGTCVGNALKWFPDRRGLAAGLTSMGFGAGSALTDRAHLGDDQGARIRVCLPRVRDRAGAHGVPARLVSATASGAVRARGRPRSALDAPPFPIDRPSRWRARRRSG